MRTIGQLAASITVAALTLAGCSGDAITSNGDNSFEAVAIEASAKAARPWKGDCELEAVFTGANTLLITGVCQIAHMGRATLVQNQTIDWSDGTFEHVAVYTAANGDQLQLTGSGSTVPKPDGSGLFITGTENVDGGTGRFAGATGTVAINGENFLGPVLRGIYHLDGRVTY